MSDFIVGYISDYDTAWDIMHSVGIPVGITGYPRTVAELFNFEFVIP